MVRLCAFGRTVFFSIAHLYHQTKTIEKMTTNLKTLQLTLLTLLITSFSFSQGVFTKIDSLIKNVHDKNPTISFSVGFIKNDKEFYATYGNLDRENNIKVDRNSLFEIASITKILTSNLIAQAALDNKLKLDDYIDNYLPKQYQLQKGLQNKVRISDLASHQSGLPDIDFRALIMANSQQPTDAVNQQMLSKLINNCKELIDFGNYKYSTISYVLLGQILETVYHKTYPKILDEKLITPLKLTRTFSTNFNVDNKVQGYNSEGGKQELFNWGNTGPAGLVKSNALDMIRYLKAVLNKNNTLGKAALLCEKVQYNKNERQLGLGLNILKERKNTVFLKTGDLLGQSSIMAYDREHKWGIIILLNQRNHKLRQELFKILFEIIKTK
jgi:CubicO group peptidase (beta-lactamase class C family)